MQAAQLSNENTHQEGTVYYSPHAIVVLAHNFRVASGDRTLERKSLRLLLSCNSQLSLKLDQNSHVCYGILLAPNAHLETIDGVGSDIILIDLPITSNNYCELSTLLAGRNSLTLPKLNDHGLTQLAIRGQEDTLRFADVENLVESISHHAINQQGSTHKSNRKIIDPRIQVATERIKTTSLNDIRLKDFAREACLSADRFRHLFKEQTGATFSYYARSYAVWKTLALRETNQRLTEACLAAGFYDLSHFYRAYYETFGVYWKENNNVRKLKRVRFYETLVSETLVSEN